MLSTNSTGCLVSGFPENNLHVACALFSEFCSVHLIIFPITLWSAVSINNRIDLTIEPQLIVIVRFLCVHDGIAILYVIVCIQILKMSADCIFVCLKILVKSITKIIISTSSTIIGRTVENFRRGKFVYLFLAFNDENRNCNGIPPSIFLSVYCRFHGWMHKNNTKMERRNYASPVLRNKIQWEWTNEKIAIIECEEA